jgi:uncharacterized Zn finger protein (UPF0148 family)
MAGGAYGSPPFTLCYGRHCIGNIYFQTFKMIKFLLKVFRFLSDTCTDCGGMLSEHINGKYYCDECGKRN